ncbi:MAG TPA: 2Fe-2S iron-sulfur cluster binding domain-containing protein [Firmicutes bacterium]|nr:2Fe-2S iron-sulfur cluster binding domain-containing protein [Bacillota bacterium]
MSGEMTIKIDGVEMKAKPGQTVMQAALDAGIYIPHLCFHPDIHPHGSCRVCTVMINGRPMAACTTPAESNMDIQNDTEQLKDLRRAVVEMLFVEGNHYCMFCERSGNCELQALAYRLGILVPRYPYMFPVRSVDSSHPDVFLDRNRCIQCGRCVFTSRDNDNKHVFELVGRSVNTWLGVDSDGKLIDTDLCVNDKSVSVCPVGAINLKGTAFKIPIGNREYDHEPIGSDIEAGRTK